ncbi:DNA polymerase III subunit delta [Cryobacterium sp. TMT2-10]|uniref:DNA-directed DNA polymerase n=1 Tax=Cryobacterium shii TaxID=1259235 RepID=A0AAQ2C953_9MICO|nr:DNA polymerase III subunit delta [Cryobacterium shii]TFC84400.1 DNA polymerase III subunit delta [Cryobacterium sp. TmT2-59]TFD18492.1 DNA polymerase III subunit delta [Cryobacterium sp. TMT4-10]TFD26275.1 DNA polymerase III subunit delta [Cryobacterium sp. TMT2-23]TFD40530.1 DNA polymerase III subunit delta [Cryobacterium sp. TMT2-10]
MAARTASAGRTAPRSAPKAAPKSAAIPQLAWHQVRPAPIVLVSGTEVFLAERAIRQLRDFLKLEDPSLEISDVQADSYSPGELLTVASPSLFGEPRLIRVSSVEKCSDTFLAEAIDYLQNPAEDTYLVLRHGGGVRGKKLLDLIRAGTGGGIEVVCAELKKDTDRHDFASSEFKAAGKRVTPSALRSLVGAFSGDLAELSAACQQLIADTGAEVTETTVDRYYGGRVEANAFKVADAAIAGHRGEALVILRHALASGADPVPVVAAFAMKIRTMAKLCGVRGGSAQLASQYGLAPWQVERAQRDLRGWSDEGLARCVVALAETDAAVKGAERDPVFALERLIGVIARKGES